MARPRAIQGEVEQRLLEALGAGAPIRIACGYAGCGADAYYAERERNPDFAERADRARYAAAVKSLQRIESFEAEDWRAAAKRLELMFPDDFGRRLEVSGPAGGPLHVAAEVQPGFVADVLRRLSERSDAPVEEGGE